MPKVVVAREAGACYGVERALRMARRAGDQARVSGGGAVFTLGPLIHNPRVVAELEAAGVGVAATPADARGATLILRTHGVPPTVEAEARELCARVLDATCPFVKQCHANVERLAREGYQVVVVGEAGHPEVEGTLGHAPAASVVGSAEEAAALAVGRRVGVVVQTTMARAVLDEVAGVLLARADEVRVFNTICDATSGHQAACAELAREADCMLVVGGRNSANTRHLADIARALCPDTHHVEGADELDPAWFRGRELVGITAGASTPAAQIEAVRAAVEALAGECA